MLAVLGWLHVCDRRICFTSSRRQCMHARAVLRFWIDFLRQLHSWIRVSLSRVAERDQCDVFRGSVQRFRLRHVYVMPRRPVWGIGWDD